MVATLAYHVAKRGRQEHNFFQSKYVWRARKNRIKQLHDADVNVYTDTDTMSNMATSYFKDIFTAAPSPDASGVVDLVNTVIADNDNDKLCAEFTDHEISDALFQIGPLKAPGPDGFPARFFQRNWEVLKENIIRVVNEFFKTGIMPEGVNETSIVLIPKVATPTRVSEF